MSPDYRRPYRRRLHCRSSGKNVTASAAQPEKSIILLRYCFAPASFKYYLEPNVHDYQFIKISYTKIVKMLLPDALPQLKIRHNASDPAGERTTLPQTL